MARRIFEVKNPGLYTALKEVCGKVHLSSEGDRAVYRAENQTALDMGKAKPYPVWDVKGGERYIARCPFCGREKLWVSYLAGCSLTVQERVIDFSRGLIICYRCRFDEDPIRRQMFWDKLEAAGYRGNHREIKETEEARIVYGSMEADDVEVIPLPVSVPLSSTQCPATVTQYLLGRGIDPVDLAKCTGCLWSDRPLGLSHPSVGRIIFPVWQNRVMVGWQGRALDNDIKGTSIPKYYFPKGGTKERWLYNIDTARWSSVGVLVEGVFDVYKVGPAGVGQFGKVTGLHQLKTLSDVWGDRAVVIIPDRNDPKAFDIARESVAQWNLRGLFKQGAHLCLLPQGKDPGELEHKFIASLIKQQTGFDIPLKEDTKCL